MRKLQWLKTRTGLFSDPRMLCLMNQSNCDSYIVLRFWESDIKKDLQKCVDTICKYCGR